MTGLVGAATYLAACGGGDLDPGAGNAPGTGTGTLAIDGAVHATPRMINARRAADFDTELTVRVSLDNRVVTTGSVTITSLSGKIPLTVHGDERWTGSLPVYDEVYVLDVENGADQVVGVRVDGPDIHVFSAPKEGARIDSTMPLTLAWQRAGAAGSTELRGDGIKTLAIPDTGSYALAGGSLKADKSLDRQQTLRLLRTNTIVPSGTAAGSSWTVTIENRVDVITEAQPLPL